MSKLFYLSLILLVAGFSSCKKTKGPSNVKSAQQDNSVDSLVNVKMYVNGLVWHTDSVFSYKVKNSANDTSTYNYMVTATNVANKTTTLVINIMGYNGLKNYTVNPPFTTITYYSDNHRYFATSGTFNIQSDTDNVLSGTFNFIADTIVSSKGTFRLAMP
jgi:hypothetical protein